MSRSDAEGHADAAGRATVPGVAHHWVDVDDTTLHYVSAGTSGSPIMLVHGFPESWWVFHRVIPLLARHHRVFAVDMRGFGDSRLADDTFSSAVAARDLQLLIEELAVGPVHLAGQDISGGAVVRLAVQHPHLVRSLIAAEMGLPGFGLEAFADVTHGGSWHLGALAAPGVAGMLFEGRERQLLSEWALPSMTVVEGSFASTDIDELVRVFERPGGWLGAAGIYRSILSEGGSLRALLATSPLRAPVLAIGGSGGEFTGSTMAAATGAPVTSVVLEGVGHHVAMEAPSAYADAVVSFTATVDGGRG